MKHQKRTGAHPVGQPSAIAAIHQYVSLVPGARTPTLDRPIEILVTVIFISLLTIPLGGCDGSASSENESVDVNDAVDSSAAVTHESGETSTAGTAAVQKTTSGPAARQPDIIIPADGFIDDDLDRVERLSICSRANLLLVAVKSKSTNTPTRLFAVDMQTKHVIWKISGLDLVQDLAVAPQRGEVFIWMTGKLWFRGRRPPSEMDRTKVDSLVVSIKDGSKVQQRTMPSHFAEGRDHKIAVHGHCIYSNDESTIAIFDDRGLTILDPSTLEEKRQCPFDGKTFVAERGGSDFIEARPSHDAFYLYGSDEIMNWKVTETEPRSAFRHNGDGVFPGRLTDGGLLIRGTSVYGYQVVQSGEAGVTGPDAYNLPFRELHNPIGLIPRTDIAIFPNDASEYQTLNCMRVTKSGLERTETLAVPKADQPKIHHIPEFAMDRDGKCIALLLNDRSIAVWNFQAI